jgi:aryl-alcohol dehydrogenase-like predicted oxidoreductase
VLGETILEAVKDIAASHSATPAQVALQYLQNKPGVDSVLVGARTMAQLTDNLGASEWRLTTDEMDLLDRVSARPLPYPYWHQRQYNATRFRRL